jgi:alkylhydroperoxidase/carboxymuconolactone decarboxylase family protein YurZ
MTQEPLPAIVEAFARRHPEVWECYNRLGQAAGKAGPLDARTERLIKLAIAAGGGLEGAFRSHVRRGLAAGLSREELEHVAILAITTVGWPTALAAYSWLHDEIGTPNSAETKE